MGIGKRNTSSKKRRVKEARVQSLGSDRARDVRGGMAREKTGGNTSGGGSTGGTGGYKRPS